MSVCVCVIERERERERESVCVCVWGGGGGGQVSKRVSTGGKTQCVCTYPIKEQIGSYMQRTYV